MELRHPSWLAATRLEGARGPHVPFAAAAAHIFMRLATTALIIGVAVVFVPSRSAATVANEVPRCVSSPIACENARPGLAPDRWQVQGAGDPTIQGFATRTSVNVGETISFKVKTAAARYHIEILRMGYYQGNGARLVATIRPSASSARGQPACLKDATSGLIDCGNWAVTASWSVPRTAVSGVFLAHLVREDTGGSSLVPFDVRNDASRSDLIFQTSDETWEAYNNYGGNSLYMCHVACPPGNPGAYKAAYKVSYNRPYNTAAANERTWLMSEEYPMIRFLERNGYDVTYTSGLDVATRGELLTRHKVFLSVGHDEYWSGEQRANVEAARDHGVNLAFFSGNEVFWKTRWEGSIDRTRSDDRTLVSYKETHFDAAVDPQDPPTWTGSWADPRFSPPADGGRPQNSLTGQFFTVNSGTTDIVVPAKYHSLRLWRNTAVARLRGAQSLTLGNGTGTLGYEWDETPDNGFQPPGLIAGSETTITTAERFVDYGTNTSKGRTATHHLTMYRAPSGALVFGAGTVQWSWGLDNAATGQATDATMQQATVNLLADMHAQPATLAAGLRRATASTDRVPPTSHLAWQGGAGAVRDGTVITLRGTAADGGGGVVGGVEVSTDSGKHWHPASGTTSWTYRWTVHGSPEVTVRTRAVDDSGNLESPSGGQRVDVQCPCSIWSRDARPATIDSTERHSVDVGTRFSSQIFGTLTAIHFYKAVTNTGPHTVDVWSDDGLLLASAAASHETPSGWQIVPLPHPVPILPDTTYVASYFAPRGHYSFTPNDGTQPVVDSAPLQATGHPGTINGVFSYSQTDSFPATVSASDYMVDVTLIPGQAPGQVSHVAALAFGTSATLTWRAPASGGPATRYVISLYEGSGSKAVAEVPVDEMNATFPTSGTPPTSAILTGLRSGTKYAFRITAVNPVGNGPESQPSRPVIVPGTSDSGTYEAVLWVILALTIFWTGAVAAVGWILLRPGPSRSAEGRPA